MSKNVLMCGFFGMKRRHAEIYKSMWESIGTKVEIQGYEIHQAATYTGWKSVRKTARIGRAHYDAAFVMSGGSLHLHNLVHSDQGKELGLSYDRLIYDSGPYLPKASHANRYVSGQFGFPISVEGLVRAYWGWEGYVDDKEEIDRYLSTTHATSIPKLCLLSENDKLIDKQDVENVMTTTDSSHCVVFSEGKHADIYRHNKEQYLSSIDSFMCE